MASSEKSRGSLKRVLPVLAKVVALCVVAVFALLLLLPAPPERSVGGVTRVTKHVPKLRDTVDPLRPTPEEAEPARGPTVIQAPPPVEPQQPASVTPQTATPAGLPPSPQRKPDDDSAEKTGSDGTNLKLPWTTPGDVANVQPQRQPAGVPGTGSGLPGQSDIQDWLRSQAWEFLGGVDPQGNILYRFEVWLEAPASVLNEIKSVNYVYDAPSATPAQRESANPKNGFRARFGSLSCAKKVTVNVTMADGRSQQAVADGCRALN